MRRLTCVGIMVLCSLGCSETEQSRSPGENSSRSRKAHLGDDPISVLAVSHDGSRAAAVHLFESTKITVWDTKGGTLLQTILNDADVYDAALSPAGDRLITSDLADPPRLRVWRVSDGSLICELTLAGVPVDSGLVHEVAATADGGYIVATAMDTAAVDNRYFTLVLWRLSDGALVRALEGLEEEIDVKSLRVTLDGQYLIALGEQDRQEVETRYGETVSLPGTGFGLHAARDVTRRRGTSEAATIF